VAGKFQHIVHIAGFRGFVAQPVPQGVRSTEIFMVSVFAGHIRMVVHNGFPEKFCCPAVCHIAGKLVTACKPYQFGYLGVPNLAIGARSISFKKIGFFANETPRRRAAGYLKGIIFIY